MLLQFALKLCIQNLHLLFIVPNLMHSLNILLLVHIFQVSYSKYQCCKNLKNNSNYLIVSNSHYETLHFFTHLHNCSNLLQLYWLQVPSQQHLPQPQQIQDISYKTSMLHQILSFMHKLLLKNKKGVLLFQHFHHSFLPQLLSKVILN